MARKITTQPSIGANNLQITGKLAGKRTYLQLNDAKTGRGLGVIEGEKLRRLAQAILRQFRIGNTSGPFAIR